MSLARNIKKAAFVGVSLCGAVACACGGHGVECKTLDVRAEDHPSVSAAVAACASRGGGRVTVGPGVTRSAGPVVLRSNVELHLEEGATIEFSDRPEDYMPGVPVSWEGVECYNLSPLVYAYGCTNVAITGKGVLKAKTAFWWSWAGARTSECKAAARLLRGEWPRAGVPIAERQLWKQPGAAFRPQFLHFNRCKGVRLEGVSVRGSPFWTIHAFLCDGVTLRDLDVDATGDDGRMINNSDGIDVDASRNVLIENCTFAQGDDAIVLKSGRDFDGWRIATPTENVVVRGCTVRSGHNLLAIGSELSGGIRNVSVSDCRVVGVIGELVNIKTNRRRGGFAEDVRLENVVAGRIRYDVVGLNTRHYYGAPGNEALERDRPTSIRGIAVRNVRCSKAPRRLNLRGDFLRPVADVTIDNVVVDDSDGGDYVVSVENLRIDGRPVRPTAAVATADELGSVDLDAAIWQPETREYLLATTDGTVAGTAIRRSLDRKLWSEPVPSLWAEERFADAAVGFVKIRREKNGWYMDVTLDSVPRSYFTPEIFWPFRPESFFAPKEQISVGAVNCGRFGYGRKGVSEREYADGWAALAANSPCDVFFYEDVGTNRFPRGSRGLDGLDIRVVLKDGEGDMSVVELPRGIDVGDKTLLTPRYRALRVVRESGGRKIAFYGVHLVAEGHIRAPRPPHGEMTAAQKLRREQFRALMEDARKFDFAVFAGDFNAQKPFEYEVFKDEGYLIANCSREFGAFSTLRDIPADNIVVSPGMDIAQFDVLQRCKINTDHFPVVAKVGMPKAAAGGKALPSR